MSALSLLGASVSLQFMLALALGITTAIVGFEKAAKIRLEARTKLQFAYLSLTLMLLLFVARPWLPQHTIVKPQTKVFSTEVDPTCCRKKDRSRASSNAESIGRGERSLAKGGFWEWFAYAIFLWGIAVIAWILSEHLRFRRELGAYLLAHRIGRAEIYYAAHLKIPFAAWLPGRRIVVLPPPNPDSTATGAIVRAHELQHHRQLDTVTAAFLRFVELFCFWNPAAHFWIRNVRRTQEFACDETLIFQRGVSPRAYARCLWEAASIARTEQPAYVPGAGTIGLFGERPFLLRRIQMMSHRPGIHRKCPRPLALLALCFAVVSFAAVATQKLVQDRTITKTQAEKLAVKANRRATIPVVINDEVLRQLNLKLGTSESRNHIKEALERMKALRPQIEAKLKTADFPMELLAIPLVESGYQNLPAKNDRGNGAGIWMFIESTAKAFNLVVNEKRDDRLDIDKETDAMIAYFKKLRSLGDWDLAILAYNCGESAVKNKKDELKTNDVWKIIKGGVTNDPDYLASVYAGILILKNPEIAI